MDTPKANGHAGKRSASRDNTGSRGSDRTRGSGVVPVDDEGARGDVCITGVSVRTGEHPGGGTVLGEGDLTASGAITQVRGDGVLAGIISTQQEGARSAASGVIGEGSREVQRAGSVVGDTGLPGRIGRPDGNGTVGGTTRPDVLDVAIVVLVAAVKANLCSGSERAVDPAIGNRIELDG